MLCGRRVARQRDRTPLCRSTHTPIPHLYPSRGSQDGRGKCGRDAPAIMPVYTGAHVPVAAPQTTSCVSVLPGATTGSYARHARVLLWSFAPAREEWRHARTAHVESGGGSAHVSRNPVGERALQPRETVWKQNSVALRCLAENPPVDSDGARGDCTGTRTRSPLYRRILSLHRCHHRACHRCREPRWGDCAWPIQYRASRLKKGKELRSKEKEKAPASIAPVLSSACSRGPAYRSLHGRSCGRNSRARAGHRTS